MEVIAKGPTKKIKKINLGLLPTNFRIVCHNPKPEIHAYDKKKRHIKIYVGMSESLMKFEVSGLGYPRNPCLWHR